MSWPPPRSYRGRARPCRCAHARASAMSRPSVTIQKLYRDPRSCRACCNTHAPCRKALGAVSQPFRGLCRDTRPPPSHDTMFVSRLPHQQGCVRALCRMPLCASRPCRGRYWPCRRAVSHPYHVVSWWATTRPCAPLRTCCAPWPCLSSPVSQYSLLYCDSNLEKMGSSPFQLHCTFSLLFFFFIFFIVPATGKPPKKIYIIFFFHFPV